MSYDTGLRLRLLAVDCVDVDSWLFVVQGSQDARLFSHPLCLGHLARFTLEAFCVAVSRFEILLIWGFITYLVCLHVAETSEIFMLIT